jgi:hypothetical protein
MGFRPTVSSLDREWNGDNSSLEQELLLYDFFRRDEEYSAQNPLVLCRDGGLMAVYAMDGLDPEPMGEDGLEGASRAIRRAMDVFNPMNQEGVWRLGTWEVQNIWTRALGSAHGRQRRSRRVDLTSYCVLKCRCLPLANVDGPLHRTLECPRTQL